MSEPKLMSPRATLTFGQNLDAQLAQDARGGETPKRPVGGIFRFAIERAELVNLKKRVHGATGLKVEVQRDEETNEFAHSGVAQDLQRQGHRIFFSRAFPSNDSEFTVSYKNPPELI